jgi:predicted component of type VI protein secretion system
VLEPVSVGLKLAFLAVLYLFLLWVARSALKDLRRPVGAGPARPPANVTEMATVAPGMPSARRAPRLVVESAPGHDPGMEYDLHEKATLGRGEVEIHLEDPFASTHHARLSRQGGAMVLEDLGSTNGTYLNEELLDGPRPLHPGDRIRIGDSTFTYEDQ